MIDGNGTDRKEGRKMADLYRERVEALRRNMEREGVDIYLIPTSDYHSSEYVGDYFKERAFLTGFTGSAGTAVVARDEAGLWTDGRYFIQAERQLAGSGVTLFPMGQPKVPTVAEYVKEKLPEGGCIGFDGRCIAASDARRFCEIAREKGGRVMMEKDLVAPLWTDRPSMPKEPVWILEEKYAGESVESKLSRIRDALREIAGKKVGHLVSSLYDIAWILNLRGNDISHVPVFLSYLYLTMDQVHLYADSSSWSDEVKAYLADHQIALHPYGEIYSDLTRCGEDVVVLDETLVNAGLVDALRRAGVRGTYGTSGMEEADVTGSASGHTERSDATGSGCAEKAAGEGIKILHAPNPSEKMRSVKNATEIANTREAHVKDGVAVTKFICWLKRNFANGSEREHITELSAAEYLYQRRKEQADFLDVSFDTISAYGPNAAMMHYAATEESFADLKPEGFLLVDSGGHYLQGTTDVTRTIALGALTDQMREYFTTVLRCNLRLAAAKFPKGCCGQNLDVLARGPVWDLGLDYRCGTGHGVGHILNVHEGPNAFRWRIPAAGSGAGNEITPLEPGMITTDEPGLYVEGAFGIRTENELLCVEAETTEYGEFLAFEPITYVPIDLDAVIPEMLSPAEKAQLNGYHRKVYETVSPYLDEDERRWLKEATREIG